MAALLGLIFGVLAADCASAEPRYPGQLDLRADCGATGDGESDDSGALRACLQRMQQEMDAGHPSVLRIPAGLYRITGANGPMPTLERHGGAIQGDGPHASYIVLDPSYAGDVFSWSEAWMADNVGPKYDPRRDMSGPTLTGLQITVSSAAPNRQNAVVFYDRDDHVLLRDIEVDGLNGRCLSMGHTLRRGQAYVRESAFYNVKCFGTGTPDAPAVEISSTTQPGSDATNELDFYKLAIFDAKSDGLVMSNPNNASATRRTRFFGLRVERTGRDAIVIGAPNDRGRVADIYIVNLSVVRAGAVGLHIGAGDLSAPPYQISVLGGAIGPGVNTSIRIAHGALIDIDLSHVDSAVIAPRTGSIRISPATPEGSFPSGG
jgi:hypothetical protein